ncbi:MAG: hypothetical protein UX08_C0029G0010 [Candidatus Collierbacteria bacterium GW2011_GWB1_45_35]|nr:MAG: hypothetical protein UX08_C0029G0010 [Candidatus Collierbacteria bacterium GW2011_GWB1_45_35]
MRYCTTNSYKLILAGVPGLEPGMTVLETVVIPLHYTPIKVWQRILEAKTCLWLHEDSQPLQA